MALHGFARRAFDVQIGEKVRRSPAVLLIGLALALGGALVALCCRFWRTSVLLLSLGFLVLSSGRWAPLHLLGVLVVLFGAWRLFRPESFRADVHPVVGAWWARWWRYSRRWSTLMDAHRLVVVTDRHGARSLSGDVVEPTIRYPRIRTVVWTPSTDRVLVQLTPGLAPTHLEAAADSLAHATKALACRIRVDRPGRVWLEFLRRHPLTATIEALPVPAPAKVDLKAVPIGRREDGNPWRLPVLGTHTLVVGATGAGKASVLWSLLSGLAPAIAAGTVQPWGFDPKGGMELALGRPLFARVFTDDPEAMAEALEEAADAMSARAKRLAGTTRLHTPSVEEPLIFVVIDELATLTAFCDRKTAARVEKALGRLLTQGRAPGCSVVAFLQDPGKDVVAYRNLFPTRVALRLTEAIEVDMVLGDGARDRGALADHIDPATPGVGYVRLDGTPDPIRVRAGYLSDEQIRALAATFPYGSARHHDLDLTATRQRPQVDLSKRHPFTAGEAA